MLIEYQEMAPSLAQFDEHLKELDDFLVHQKRNVVVLDGTKSKNFLPSPIRIRQAEWLKENFDTLRAKSPLYIYVVPNTIAQLMMKGVFLLTKNPTPYKVVKSKAVAMGIARAYWEAHPIASSEIA
ncbi:MAG TPA: hypothetical protein DCE41_31505 [Cytophagales bacterium]|nr:hypothetical protein [Cytophagales bacterium]